MYTSLEHRLTCTKHQRTPPLSLYLFLRCTKHILVLLSIIISVPNFYIFLFTILITFLIFIILTFASFISTNFTVLFLESFQLLGQLQFIRVGNNLWLNTTTKLIKTNHNKGYGNKHITA